MVNLRYVMEMCHSSFVMLLLPEEIFLDEGICTLSVDGRRVRVRLDKQDLQVECILEHFCFNEPQSFDAALRVTALLVFLLVEVACH